MAPWTAAPPPLPGHQGPELQGLSSGVHRASIKRELVARGALVTTSGRTIMLTLHKHPPRPSSGVDENTRASGLIYLAQRKPQKFISLPNDLLWVLNIQ